MYRSISQSGIVLAAALSCGCAGTWDTMTSRSFRKDPWNATYRLMVPEDPLVVLRSDPPRNGDQRAAAMRRLKEPLRNQRTQQEQDEIIDLLARTATADPSPVLRLAAIEALGQFEDPRAAGILVIAYQNAHGRPVSEAQSPDSGIRQLGGPTRRSGPTDRLSLTGPTGFAPDAVATIRCRSLEALGRTGSEDGIRLLAAVANPQGDSIPDGADDPEVRQAAVRGLGKCRQPEAVHALAQVLAAHSGKDHVMAAWAHDGLMRLTGKRLPPDPQQWDAVVQAGVVIAPEPNFIQTAFEWVKP